VNPVIRILARIALARSDAALVRASGGAPRVVAGRTLDARFQFLEAQARRRPAPAVMTPAIGRQGANAMTALFGGRTERGVSWSPLPIAADARTIQTRLYRPAVQDPAQPTLVYFHFGGGVVGDLETCHAFCTILCAALGGPVLSVAYRLAPEHRWPAGLEDCIHAYQWTLANAASFGAPQGKAAVGGDSMGGNFSAIIAQEMKRRGATQPIAQLLIYPAVTLAEEHASMTDFADAFPLTRATMDWFMSQYLPPDSDLRDPRLSPLCEEDLADLAPALVYTAGFDPLSDQGEAYANALSAAGVKTAHMRFDSLAHGFTAFTGVVPAADAACRLMAREFAALVRARR